MKWKGFFKKTKCWRIWKLFSKDNISFISNIVTILGIISIVAMVFNYRKELKENKVNETIIDAVSIFNAASDIADYKEALDLFLKVKESRPNNLTGYNLFLELAKQTNEIVRNNNDTIYKYDSLVEKYFQYADSLNYRQKNEAANLLKQLQTLKNDEQ